MSADVRHFRRKVFGGFDTGDVMRYIEDLAAQRNKYKTSGDKLEVELKSLTGEIKRLQAELEAADRRITDIKVKALDETAGSMTTLRASYTNIRSEMEQTTYTITTELSKLSSTLTMLTSVLDKTGCRFTELQSAVEIEKAEALAARGARYIS